VNLRTTSLVRLRSYVRCVAFATIGSFGFGTAAGGLPDTAPATAHESTTAVPTWLWGVWSRDWIQVGKVRTNTVNVHYLQTPTYFSDVRIPKDRPRFSSAASFTDLSDADLRLLAKQSGFIGVAPLLLVSRARSSGVGSFSGACANTWTWANGANAAIQNGTHGTEGKAAPAMFLRRDPMPMGTTAARSLLPSRITLRLADITGQSYRALVMPAAIRGDVTNLRF
jgi:hypothetical protein